MILVAASVSPTTRVAFRTDLTGRRFSEAQQLLVTRADTAAFSDFIGEVNSTQQDLSRLSNSQDKIKNADKLIAAIDQYQIQLSQAQNQVLVAQGSQQAPTPTTAVLVPGSQTPEKNVCVQVITYARNPNNGTCQSFSTPCDVPDGWQSCSLVGSSQPTPVSAPSQGPSAPSSTPTIPTAQPFQAPSPAPSLAPTVSNEIATNVAKREEVKNTISNTKEELQKIKEKLQKDREEEETKQKIKEEQDKLKQNIEESKKSGQNQ